MSDSEINVHKDESEMAIVAINFQALANDCRDAAYSVNMHCSRIYDLIRAVGEEKKTADNALHCIVEDYVGLVKVGKDLRKISRQLEEISDPKHCAYPTDKDFLDKIAQRQKEGEMLLDNKRLTPI